MIIYLSAAEEGGETEFLEINQKIVAAKGSAVMFYNLKPRFFFLCVCVCVYIYIYIYILEETCRLKRRPPPSPL